MWRIAAGLLLAAALAVAAGAPGRAAERRGAEETRRCVAALFCLESRRTDVGLALWLEARTPRELTLLVSLELFAPRSESYRRKLVVERPGRWRLFFLPLGPDERLLFTWDVVFHPGAVHAGAPARGPDPTAVYRLPYGAGESYRVLQGTDGAFSHRGRDRFAVDFAMPPGTLVRAARAGRVTGLFDRSADGGGDARWRGADNFLWIEHADGSVGWYAHFRHDGILVEPGQAIAAGQALGYAGGTGLATEPHLHFHVSTLVADPEEAYRTLPLRFWLADGTAARLEAGRNYPARSQ